MSIYLLKHVGDGSQCKLYLTGELTPPGISSLASFIIALDFSKV